MVVIATHETNKARINKEIYGLVCDASRKVLANNPVGWQMFFGAMTDAARAGDPLVVQYVRQLTGDGILPREWHVGEAQIEQILEGYYGRLLAKISDEVMRQRGSDCLLSK